MSRCLKSGDFYVYFVRSSDIWPVAHFIKPLQRIKPEPGSCKIEDDRLKGRKTELRPHMSPSTNHPFILPIDEHRENNEYHNLILLDE